jgi:hypothetical protein
MEGATMSHRWISVSGALSLLALALVWGLPAHQAEEHAAAAGSTPHNYPKAPIKITAEELHRLGGVPPGWQFRFAEGDPTAGRAVFAKLECYQCHTIQGEPFPQDSTSTGNAGPELTGMGDHHPVEYFAESILNPNAIIVIGPGYTDAAGMSIMPDYRDSLTVAELIDLVAYVKSLRGSRAHDAAGAHHGHDDRGALLDQVVGDYRIRIMYHEGKAGSHSHEAHSHRGIGESTAKAEGQGHLMVFVTDAKTGEPIPYLPMSAAISTTKQSPRTIKLLPMIGDHGFHYGADVTLPHRAAKVTLAIEPTTMRVMPSAAGRFAQSQQVSFDWAPPPPTSPDAGDHASPQQGHGQHGSTKGPR